MSHGKRAPSVCKHPVSGLFVRYRSIRST